MSDAAAPAPKKKGKMRKLLIMGVAIGGLIGGGVAGGIYAAGSGMVGGAHAKAEPEVERPKLVLREGQHGSTEGHPGKDGEDHSPDPRLYKASYVPLEQSFTANLADTDGFLQLGLGVSTYYDEQVVENLKDNEMPVRSAVLMVLAQQHSDALSLPEGKTRLQAQLKDAVNRTLRQKTGFGGVNDVYFTSFVIQ